MVSVDQVAQLGGPLTVSQDGHGPECVVEPEELAPALPTPGHGRGEGLFGVAAQPRDRCQLIGPQCSELGIRLAVEEVGRLDEQCHRLGGVAAYPRHETARLEHGTDRVAGRAAPEALPRWIERPADSAAGLQ